MLLVHTHSEVIERDMIMLGSIKVFIEQGQEK